jgi:hypothetical protein
MLDVSNIDTGCFTKTSPTKELRYDTVDRLGGVYLAAGKLWSRYGSLELSRIGNIDESAFAFE